MTKVLRLDGERFGRLIVIERAENNKHGRSQWKCLCACGNIVTVEGHKLSSGHTKSCGCLQKDAARTAQMKHGESKSRLYECWHHMKSRCINPNNKDYCNYGGRGIQVCAEWSEYEAFKGWAITHGYRDDLTIDRIDVNGDYCPENCRWATVVQQANNRRSNCVIEYDGEAHTLTEWSQKLGISFDALQLRLKRNWSVEKAFNTPVRICSRNVESKA